MNQLYHAHDDQVKLKEIDNEIESLLSKIEDLKKDSEAIRRYNRMFPKKTMEENKSFPILRENKRLLNEDIITDVLKDGEVLNIKTLHERFKEKGGKTSADSFYVVLGKLNQKGVIKRVGIGQYSIN